KDSSKTTISTDWSTWLQLISREETEKRDNGGSMHNKWRKFGKYKTSNNWNGGGTGDQMLMSYIKSIEVGKLYSVREMLCDGLDENDKVNGCYRDVEELVLKLAEFYINSGEYNILTFDEPNTFHIALGGDGAPLGKDDTACSWLLMTDLERIQKKSYSVLAVNGESVQVKFVIGELPNDMKMLAFLLGGELTNSATYFSTFADVSKDTIVDCKGLFGPQPTDTWKPWVYTKRVRDAKAVEKFKQKLNPNISEKTRRSKVTGFIAKQKSRQEFIPLVADLINKAHIEPLHLKNHACALAHSHLLKLVISWSNLSTSISTFSQVPLKSPFYSRVKITEDKVGELELHRGNFYRGYCLYFHVNPTVWSLGNVVHKHTQEMKL
ncbi:Hypothetical predicted protein, partial [Paramuricea clavata]